MEDRHALNKNNQCIKNHKLCPQQSSFEECKLVSKIPCLPGTKSLHGIYLELMESVNIERRVNVSTDSLEPEFSQHCVDLDAEKVDIEEPSEKIKNKGESDYYSHFPVAGPKAKVNVKENHENKNLHRCPDNLRNVQGKNYPQNPPIFTGNTPKAQNVSEKVELETLLVLSSRTENFHVQKSGHENKPKIKTNSSRMCQNTSDHNTTHEDIQRNISIVRHPYSQRQQTISNSIHKENWHKENIDEGFLNKHDFPTLGDAVKLAQGQKMESPQTSKVQAHTVPIHLLKTFTEDFETEFPTVQESFRISADYSHLANYYSGTPQIHNRSKLSNYSMFRNNKRFPRVSKMILETKTMENSMSAATEEKSALKIGSKTSQTSSENHHLNSEKLWPHIIFGVSKQQSCSACRQCEQTSAGSGSPLSIFDQISLELPRPPFSCQPAVNVPDKVFQVDPVADTVLDLSAIADQLLASHIKQSPAQQSRPSRFQRNKFIPSFHNSPSDLTQVRTAVRSYGHHINENRKGQKTEFCTKCHQGKFCCQCSQMESAHKHSYYQDPLMKGHPKKVHVFGHPSSPETHESALPCPKPTRIRASDAWRNYRPPNRIEDDVAVITRQLSTSTTADIGSQIETVHSVDETRPNLNTLTVKNTTTAPPLTQNENNFSVFSVDCMTKMEHSVDKTKGGWVLQANNKQATSDLVNVSHTDEHAGNATTLACSADQTGAYIGNKLTSDNDVCWGQQHANNKPESSHAVTQSQDNFIAEGIAPAPYHYQQILASIIQVPDDDIPHFIDSDIYQLSQNDSRYSSASDSQSEDMEEQDFLAAFYESKRITSHCPAASTERLIMTTKENLEKLRKPLRRCSRRGYCRKINFC